MSLTTQMFSLNVPVLRTARLILRAPRLADFDAALVFNESPRTRFIGGQQERRWLWRGVLAMIGHWAVRGYGFYSLETQDGAFIGRVGVIYHDGWPEPELAWHLFDGFEGQGFAHEAALAARDDYHSRISAAPLISMVDVQNARSAALAERLGARVERIETDEDGTVAIYRHPAAEGRA